MSRAPALLAAAALATLPGCVSWFFSGVHYMDRSRPVALVETVGGVELGATTEYGVLTLGRTATEGPCRVHYLLGPTPLVDDGELEFTGAVFTRAEIDLKHQAVRVHDRAPSTDDELLVMWTPDGAAVHSVGVELATGDDIEGDVLLDPGDDLPAGAAVLRRDREGTTFVGLIAGKATIGERSYFVFAGVDRVREMLAIPEKYPVDYAPKYRPDGITVLKPIRSTPRAASETPPDPDGQEPPK